MEPYKTDISFTDEELKLLNDVLRSTKLTFSSEEALLLSMGRATNPMLELTKKIAIIFETRAKAVADAQGADVAPE